MAKLIAIPVLKGKGIVAPNNVRLLIANAETRYFSQDYITGIQVNINPENGSTGSTFRYSDPISGTPIVYESTLTAAALAALTV